MSTERHVIPLSDGDSIVTIDDTRGITHPDGTHTPLGMNVLDHDGDRAYVYLTHDEALAVARAILQRLT